jgi:hypothetical protein
LKRREKRRFKKHLPCGQQKHPREAAERFSFAGVSAANEKIKPSALFASRAKRAVN